MINIKSINLGLIFSWAGFIFLSINFIVGAKFAHINFTTFLLSNLFALSLFAITMYAPVYLSIKYKLDFSQSIKKYITNKYINSFLILIVVFINTGWYSIQLEAVRVILSIENIFILILLSYIFAIGSFIFGYKWLKLFSYFVILLFFIYILFALSTININIIKLDDTIYIKEVFNIGFMIYGTWAFSSSSIIMDIAKHSNNFREGYTSLLIGLIIGNFLLIFMGYLFAKSNGISNFNEFVILFGSTLGIVLFTLNIWSTNDSNFYSSMLALNKLNISNTISFLLLPLVSVLLVISYKSNLFDMLGIWLIYMSYIGIFFTIFWWYTIYKIKTKKANIKNNFIVNTIEV